jgi:hypothetical protein
MAVHSLTENFEYFFGRLNPSPTYEQRASSEYNSVKALLENSETLLGLQPLCFLQGSYRWQTAIHAINDVDIVLLLEGLARERTELTPSQR